MWEFALEMAVGVAVGLAAGPALSWVMRRVACPAGALPAADAAAAGLTYGVATLAHGSGFLAVFVGRDRHRRRPRPVQAEVARFHSSLASLGEIVAFTVLGLTVSLHS